MENNPIKSNGLKKTELSKQKMLKALEKTLGVVTTAARSAEIDPSTHYAWLKTDPEYVKAVENIDEITIDFGESCLHKRMNEGSDAAIIFYLKTKAKKRGYIERSEIDFTKRIPDFSGLTTEELRAALGDEDEQ
jgi:hypothetical protein